MVFKTDGNVYTRVLFLSTSKLEKLSTDYFSEHPNNDVLPFMDEMLKKHRKCPYWSLVLSYCPSCLDKKKRLIKKKILQHELTSDFTSANKVYLFVRSILIKILPVQSMGTRRNFNIFLSYIKDLLSMNSRDSISVQQMVQGIKTTKIIWMKSLELKQQQIKLEKAINYIVVRIVGPLIRSFFYVTESEMYKNRLFFFRKKTWKCLIQFATSKYKNLCHLKKVSAEWVQAKRISGHCLGVSQARFLLKKSGLRTIVNMSKAKQGISINHHLRTLLQVLTFEKQNSPETFGLTVMSVEDIYIQWKTFVSQIKEVNVQKIYFVKVDIEKCFDTINVCLLYSILKNLFTKTNYDIYKYKKLIKRNGLVKTVYFETLTKLPEMNKQKESENNKQSGSNVENIGSYFVSKNVLMEKLRSLLFCNVVKIGKHHYVQTLGIAQGSSLSSILCGAYYGHLDRTVLADIIDNNDFCVRMVDDILFVTQNKLKAKAILKLFLEGFPQFNCKINLMKTCVNFDYIHPVFGKAPVLPENGLLSFCGLGFNTKTLEVFNDFSNYKSIQTKDTISWSMTKNVGLSLKKKMFFYIRLKCLSILFDRDINTIDTITYNLMTVFAVSAVKFHCLVKQLPKKNSISSNPAFLLDIVDSLPRQVMIFISGKMRKFNRNDLTKERNVTTKRYLFPLPLKSVKNICKATFLHKLKQHGHLYSPIIQHLEQCIHGQKFACDLRVLLPKIFKEIQLK
ncbi:telomerase reverse transcriptase [Biomphalaria glabrata]|nr:telomerase reverse transcriptase [Biomphalaria glabrata]